MRIMRNIGLGVIGLVALGVVVMWAVAGPIGFADLVRHGGFYWLPVGLDSPRLSPAMRLALAKDPVATSGIVSWKTLAEGFEAGELPVMVDGQAVDSILLARIDPAKFRFEARTAPDGSRGLDEWMTALHPALVVNGSFSALDGRPDTPFKNDGVSMGPQDYDARAGAFVASDAFTGIRNLATEDWKTALADARDAMVSYPMLVRDGASGVKVPSRWLANRSFVGQDADGKIIIGTTRDAFFSLARLADFLWHGGDAGGAGGVAEISGMVCNGGAAALRDGPSGLLRMQGVSVRRERD
jgi:hypothetical protein